MSKLHFSPSLGRLSRCTAEHCPFDHFDSETMKRMAPVHGVGRISVLKHSYMGIALRPELLAPALNQLRSAMSPRLFEHITRKLQERNGAGQFHITVVSPREFRRLKNQGIAVSSQENFSFEILGVGSASNEKSQSWHAVVESPLLNRYRHELNLPRKDFHITLGFTVDDVHDAPKGPSTLL